MSRTGRDEVIKVRNVSFKLKWLLVFLIFNSLATGKSDTRNEPAEAKHSFTVTIEESAGISRRLEPTKVSLPFACGALGAATEIIITDENGKVVPAQFKVLARWNDDSIRWVLARFLANVPAQGKVALTVKPHEETSRTEGPNLVRRKGRNLVVNTGPISIQVGPVWKDGFWVFNKAGQVVFSRRPELVIYSPTGMEYRSGAPDKMELEENGPLYGSIFLSGLMHAKDSRYDGFFRWETRLHFWKGLAQVMAEHTIVAVGNASDGITIIDGIVVEFTAAQPLAEYLFAGQHEIHSGSLPAGENVRLEQTCAYWQECGFGDSYKKDRENGPVKEPVKYIVLESDFGYELKDDKLHLLARGEKAAGWLWSGANENSIGVAVRDFWEEGPKALRLGSDGSVGIECYAHWVPKPGELRPVLKPTPDYSKDPRAKNWSVFRDAPTFEQGLKRFLDDTRYPGPGRRGPFRFGQGRAKTTDVLYLFGQVANRQSEIEVLKAQRHYLIPVVDPQYLASTRAFPFVWRAACDSVLPAFEKGLAKLFENWKKRATRYGFLQFGDDQCHFGYNDTFPSTTDDQEYDTSNCLSMQFVRTGNPDYLRWTNICARHFVDVDQVHPTGELHFHGYAGGGDYHEEPRHCDMDGHPYIGGIVNHYMLTGDRRSLRSIKMLSAALRKARNVRDLVLTLDERGLTRWAICATAIYDLTRDPDDLAPAKKLADAVNDLPDNIVNDFKGKPPFRLWGLNMEFFTHILEFWVRYHAVTDDTRTLETLKKKLDRYLRDAWSGQERTYNCDPDEPGQRPRIIAQIRRPSRMEYERIMGFAYAAGITGEDRYLGPILTGLDNVEGLERNFGNRAFTRSQYWSIPSVSFLPDDWRVKREKILYNEVFRASLKEEDALIAFTPEEPVKGIGHGKVLWVNSPFGKVLRTYHHGFITFPAPKDILERPGTVSFWVRRDETRWDYKPWPWTSPEYWQADIRGLVYIGSETIREANALDVIMIGSTLWTRLYDHRGWEIVAIPSRADPWTNGEWHHITVVWDRYALMVFLNGEPAGFDERFVLPHGGQTTIYLGWRPLNRYGQADYYDLRIFRAPLSPAQIRMIYQSTRPKDLVF